MTSLELLYFANMVNIMGWLVFSQAISGQKEVKIENYRVTPLKWDTLHDWLLIEIPPVFFKPCETEAKLFPH